MINLEGYKTEVKNRVYVKDGVRGSNKLTSSPP